MQYFLSFLVLFHRAGEERAGCFTLLVILMSCDDCKCSVSLARGAMVWSAVCDCGIYSSYSDTFLSYKPSLTRRYP